MQEIVREGSSPLRPVTPHGIVARNLEILRERAARMPGLDAAFMALLAETADLAGGLEGYLAAVSTPASSELDALAASTLAHDWTALFGAGSTEIALESEMLSGHLEGQLLKFLVRATRARRILEIGCFTGYSALAMAEGLPEDGTLVACELDAYAAAAARAFVDRSPHGRKIAIEVAPAMQTLERLHAVGARFDFVFIDADKGQYLAYLDRLLSRDLLEPDGIVCVDNTLLQGEPYRAAEPSPNGRAIAEFNHAVAADPRVEQVLVPIRDGLTLIRRARP